MGVVNKTSRSLSPVTTHVLIQLPLPVEFAAAVVALVEADHVHRPQPIVDPASKGKGACEAEAYAAGSKESGTPVWEFSNNPIGPS